MTRPSVGVVDGQHLFLSGLSGLLNTCERFLVVATGTDAAAALEIARTHLPDILIVDLTVAGDPIGTIRDIRAVAPNTKVLVCTTSADVDAVVSALDAGVSGYILKGSTGVEILAAMDAVLRGETYIHQCFAAKVIAGLRQAALAQAAAEKAKLSFRERQIIQQLQQGRTNREIAAHLSISEKTVKHYMSLIMQKLQAKNRLEVVITSQQTAAGRPLVARSLS